MHGLSLQQENYILYWSKCPSKPLQDYCRPHLEGDDNTVMKEELTCLKGIDISGDKCGFKTVCTVINHPFFFF